MLFTAAPSAASLKYIIVKIKYILNMHGIIVRLNRQLQLIPMQMTINFQFQPIHGYRSLKNYKHPVYNGPLCT